MKKMLIVIGAALCISLSAHAEQNDIEVIACPQNPDATLVHISGTSALQIYQFMVKSSGEKPEKVGETMSNDMRCVPDAKRVNVHCVYLMMKGKNIPYPQLDPGFSGEDEIPCL